MGFQSTLAAVCSLNEEHARTGKQDSYQNKKKKKLGGFKEKILLTIWFLSCRWLHLCMTKIHSKLCFFIVWSQKNAISTEKATVARGISAQSQKPYPLLQKRWAAEVLPYFIWCGSCEKNTADIFYHHVLPDPALAFKKKDNSYCNKKESHQNAVCFYLLM